jgi:hypothetical protein
MMQSRVERSTHGGANLIWLQELKQRTRAARGLGKNLLSETSEKGKPEIY